jgi:hypothetical protein
MSYILILFALFNNQATAAVRIGFDSQITCVAAAKEMTEAMQRNPDMQGVKVTWSCVQQ